MFKVGIGQDSHRFSGDKEKKLILGGVELPGERGFDSNSDGDVVLHALCNALEQSIGESSFSRYADQMHEKGIDNSAEYLKVALENVRKKGYEVNNVGVNIEAKIPKIEPVSDRIKDKLASLMKLKKSNIGITATTGEELTAFGKGEGIQAFVIVSLIKSV